MNPEPLRERSKIDLEQIDEPSIGSIVYYKDKSDSIYPVYITSGEYMVYDPPPGGICNFWHWKRMNKDGTLSDKEYNGYGNFYKYNKEYKVVVKI